MTNFKKTKFQKFLHLTTLNLSILQYPGMLFAITGATTVLSILAFAPAQKDLIGNVGVSALSGLLTGIIAPFAYLLWDGLSKSIWNKIDKHSEVRSQFFNDSFYLNKLYHVLKDVPTDLKNIAVEQHKTYLCEKKAQILILSHMSLLANQNSIEDFKVNHEPLIRALKQNLNLSGPLLERKDIQRDLVDLDLQAALKKELLAQNINLIDLFENVVVQEKNEKVQNGGYLYNLQSNWSLDISNTLMVLCLQTQTLTTEQTKEICVLLEKIKDPSKVEGLLSVLIETSTSAHNMDFQVLSKFLKSSPKVNPTVAHTLQEKINILQASSGQSSQALMDIEEQESLNQSPKAASPIQNGKALFEPGILAVLRGEEIYKVCEKQSSTPGSKEIKGDLLYLRQELEFFEQNKSLFSMENAVELKLIVNRNLPALLHYLQTSDKLSEDLRPQLLAGITKTLSLVRSNVEKLKGTMGNNMLADLEVMSTHMENKKKSLTAHKR